MFSTLPSTPSLNASTGMSSSSWRAWSATQSASIGSTLSTPSVSCTVSAVITDSGWQPMLASVRRSACMPAPPDGSDALNVSTMGGEAERSMGMVDASDVARRRSRRTPDGVDGRIATIPILFYRAAAPSRRKGRAP